MTTPERISKTQLATVLGVSKGRVSQMLALGMPVDADGRVDLAAAQLWISQNIDRPDPVVSDTYLQARLINMIFVGKLLRLEYERKQARLISREQVQQRIDERVSVLRESFARFVDTITPAITAEGDPKRVHKLLKDAIRGELILLSGRGAKGGAPQA